MMNLPCGWKILLLSLWIQVGFVSGIHQDGTVSHLSKDDVLLLKDEQDPKCFTRTERDFTCFFETADNNRTYDFFYHIEGRKRCEMSVQKTEEGSFLHICSFPSSDIYSFTDTHLEVVERNTNTSLHKRDVSVEDHFLLDPPLNVSLHQNGKPGQLQVSWHSLVPEYFKDQAMYGIKYFSKGIGEKMMEKAEEGHLLDQLIPGEEVQVQVREKCAFSQDVGHWSSWSQPVRALVPQSAEDISLICFTADLDSIICQWNGSRYGDQNGYKLSYQMSLRKGSGWTAWTECLADLGLIDQCRFYSDKSRVVRVKLISTAAPLSRTFYTEEFILQKSVKTSPPTHLKASLERGKLCLTWEAPLRSLSTHLQYEVSYQTRESEDWMTRLLKGPETSTCLDVPTGRPFRVKLRAKPNRSVYSGHWSDWSEVLIGDVPADRGLLLMLCVPVSLLITAIILIVLFYTYHRKLKQYFWPPVPNLDKILQGYLTEINTQKWDPPVTAKQCSDEATSSLVEIMSAEEVSGLEKQSKESIQLVSNLSSSKQTYEKLRRELFPDYVTLNKDSVILCPKGNKYVHEQVVKKERLVMEKELFQTCQSPCSDSVNIPACDGTSFLNHSYLTLAEAAERLDSKVPAVRAPGNIYTNLSCS
ncbi:thrombopoietin receptor [Notolabrus celidotus]|uniref:thrombopoietin receptor n=1 Tax=Notolabrus celidotus TaxID=1203425 RepID=UPI0014902421|nr:thrombopoietin receptor [Notolabrus celidotus]